MRAFQGLLVAGLLLIPRVSAAQSTASTGWLSRVYFDVNIFGTAQSVAADSKFIGKALVSSEVLQTEVTYPKPAQETTFPLLDLGGGVRFGRWVSAGVLFSRASFDDPAKASISVPHPYYLNSPATASGESDSLERTEDFTNFFLAFSPFHNAHWEWRLYGGPSYVSYSAEMIQNVNYSQTATPASPSNVVTITGYDTVKVHGNALGWHAGTDLAYGLTSWLGIVGGLRVCEATVTIDREPLSGLSQDIRVGTTRIYVGVRFNVGR